VTKYSDIFFGYYCRCGFVFVVVVVVVAAAVLALFDCTN